MVLRLSLCVVQFNFQVLPRFHPLRLICVDRFGVGRHFLCCSFFFMCVCSYNTNTLQLCFDTCHYSYNTHLCSDSTRRRANKQQQQHHLDKHFTKVCAGASVSALVHIQLKIVFTSFVKSINFSYS